MPDTEISRLPELPVAAVDDTDVLAIADISASETKKISAVNLAAASLPLVPDGSIPPDKLDWPSASR